MRRLVGVAVVVVVLAGGGLVAGTPVPADGHDAGSDGQPTRAAETALAESISVSINSAPETVQVGSELGAGKSSISISVDNTGTTTETLQGIDFSGAGGQISDSAGASDTLAPGGSTTLTRTIDVPRGTNDGTYTNLDVTVDSNGTSDTVTTSITVERPAVLKITDTTLENVVVGETTEFDFTIEETNGAASDPDVTHDSATDPSGTTLSYPSPSLSAGGSTTVTGEIAVEESVEGDQTLEWEVAEPGNTGEDDTTIAAPVLLPAQFSAVELPDNAIRYDEPKDEVDVIEQEVPVAITNDGDFNLSLSTLDASFADSRLEVTDVALNGSTDPFGGLGNVTAGSQAIVDVTVEADPILPERDADMELNFSGTGAAGRTASFSDERSVQIVHETILDVDQTSLAYGETTPRTPVETEVTLSETLGYTELTGLTVEQTGGSQNGWLTVSEVPGSIAAGQSTTIVFELRFSTDAPQLTAFNWTHTVSADGVSSITINSSARTKPAGFDDVRTVLTEYESTGGSLGTLSTSMLDIIDDVETGVEDGSVPPADLSTTLTASSTLSVMLQNLEAVDRIEQNDSLDRGAAQENVVRAAAAFNTFRVFRGRYDDTQLRAAAIDIENTAAGRINETVTRQVQYLQSQPVTSTLREAEVNRQLSQLALLEGNATKAAILDEQADAAFEEYASRVDTAQQDYQTAQRQRERITEEYAVVAFGQPLILNPLEYTAFVSTQGDALSAYRSAESGFEQAGADVRAETVRNERTSTEAEFAIARQSMFVALGSYIAIAVGILWHLVTGVLDYRHDTRTTAADEFLV
jgi:hypothetical protein